MVAQEGREGFLAGKVIEIPSGLWRMSGAAEESLLPMSAEIVKVRLRLGMQGKEEGKPPGEKSEQGLFGDDFRHWIRASDQMSILKRHHQPLQ
jgi:hypothetical protein